MSVYVDDAVHQFGRMTHTELAMRAGRWLANSQRCAVVLVEYCTSTTPEQPDAIGWRRGVSVVVECKVSRSDFYSDHRKPFRRNPSTGMGSLRYYMTPKGLVVPGSLPDGWGLLEVCGRVVRVVRKAAAFATQNHVAEAALLSAAIQRLRFPQLVVAPRPVVLYRPGLQDHASTAPTCEVGG